MTTFIIREARPDEAAAVSALALRSKGHWGYDAAFLETCRADLTWTAVEIANAAAYVGEANGALLGFSLVFLRDEATAELDALFVDPAAIGLGVGKALWERSVAAARALGASDLIWMSDPHAEGFYSSRGADRLGEAESSVTPGRMLPLMHLTLRAT